MLRYDRQIKPGLVALHDMRPGNRAGLFLQPRSPHGAVVMPIWLELCSSYSSSCQHHLHLHHRAYPGCPGKWPL